MGIYKSSDWNKVTFDGKRVIRIKLDGNSVWYDDVYYYARPTVHAVSGNADAYAYVTVISEDSDYDVECTVKVRFRGETYEKTQALPHNAEVMYAIGTDGSGGGTADITTICKYDGVTVSEQSQSLYIQLVPETSTTTTYSLLSAVRTEGNFTLYREELNNESND